jgi:hypothetical protein
MLSPIWNWRTWLALIAILIVSGTIVYSNYLTQKIADDERRKVNIWAESLKTRSTTTDESALNLTNIITSDNYDIPIIGTDEKDEPIGEYLNLDSQAVRSDPEYLRNKVNEFKSLHPAIRVEISKSPLVYNNYYYGDSDLLKEVRLYPFIQLIIVALFIFIVLITISARNKSTQNLVWAGMAKEAAHQLGTPVSSLEGWIEMLKEKPGNEQMTQEMLKDIDRLKLVTDRFGKIGSIPVLESQPVLPRIDSMVQYIKKRSSEKVQFFISCKEPHLHAPINIPLFDWVLENLLKNALDAMEGQGKISIDVHGLTNHIVIDVSDTGKGISKKHLSQIYKPGFTTKKRGWGLGLTLTKRIVEHYHRGELLVKQSEPGKGTTFRIMLKKA